MMYMKEFMVMTINRSKLVLGSDSEAYTLARVQGAIVLNRL